jgi:hypothetical protein
MPGQRTGHAADRLVAGARDQAALAVARLPQLGGRELQERQRAGRPQQRVDHLLGDGRILEAEADRVERLDERLAQAVAVRRRQEHQAARELLHEDAILGHAVDEVGSHRQDHPQRRRPVVGHAGHARGEGLAQRRIADQRVELLELIDEQEHARALALGAAAQGHAQIARLLAQALVQRHGRLAALRPGGRRRVDERGQAGQRIAPGPHHQHLPLVGRAAQRRHDAGLHERRLADPGGPDHADQGQLADALDEMADISRAAVEAIGVRLLEGAQAQVRALVLRQRAAVARHQLEQRLEQLARAGVAPLHPLGQAAVDDALELRRQRRDGGGDRRHRLVRCSRHGEQLLAGQRIERVTAGQELPQDDADRPDVGAVVDLVDAPLLRGHVRHGAREAGQGRPGPQHAGVVGTAGPVSAGEQLGDAEVEDLDAPARGHEDVVRLQIAVDDVERVRVHQRGHHRDDDLDRAPRRHRAGGEEAGQRLAVEQLQHHVRRALELVDLVDDDDVLVRAARRGPRLDQKAGRELRRVGVEHLERHLAAELEVARNHHPGHAAAAELADDLVVVDARAGRQLLGQTRGARRDRALGVHHRRIERAVLHRAPAGQKAAPGEVAVVSRAPCVAHGRLRSGRPARRRRRPAKTRVRRRARRRTRPARWCGAG